MAKKPDGYLIQVREPDSDEWVIDQTENPYLSASEARVRAQKMRKMLPDYKWRAMPFTLGTRPVR